MTTERRRRRAMVFASLVVALGVLAFLAFGGIGENLVYYWSPSEMYEAGKRAEGATVRLGGLVEPGSVVRAADGLRLDFRVTDGQRSVPVHAEAVPPAMFREGIGVVVEGTMRRDGVFETNRLMIKHDNQYQAPGEGEEPDMEEMMKSLQFEATSG